MDWSSRADKLDRTGIVLLWIQVADDLRELIKSGELVPGEKLIPYPELATCYGVATVTIRRAIEALVHEGLLIVNRGHGTYVYKDINRAN